MFPFFGNPCWGGQTVSRRELNAAIETMERQMSQEENPSTNV